MGEKAQYGPTILRVILGLLFVIPGINKLMNPAGIIGMLGGLGFPMSMVFGWLLILIEIGFGATVLAGYKVKYTVWPLFVVLLVATLTVHLKTIGEGMGTIMVLFHLLGLGALVSVFLTGAGAYAVDKQ